MSHGLECSNECAAAADEVRGQSGLQNRAGASWTGGNSAILEAGADIGQINGLSVRTNTERLFGQSANYLCPVPGELSHRA
jgi:hypothetical protein